MQFTCNVPLGIETWTPARYICRYKEFSIEGFIHVSAMLFKALHVLSLANILLIGSFYYTLVGQKQMFMESHLYSVTSRRMHRNCLAHAPSANSQTCSVNACLQQTEARKHWSTVKDLFILLVETGYQRQLISRFYVSSHTGQV